MQKTKDHIKRKDSKNCQINKRRKYKEGDASWVTRRVFNEKGEEKI